MGNKHWVLLCLVAVASWAQSQPSIFKIDPESGLYVDEYGRRRIFHGVNVVEKLPPFLPSQGADDLEHSLNDNDIALLRYYGMNAVRLGVMWRAVVPEEGKVDTLYLTMVKALIQKLAQNGISTIVDAHQDVLSPYMCGEGMPDWAFNKTLQAANFNTSDVKRNFPRPFYFVFPRDPDGKPSLEACSLYTFFDYYITYESTATFSALYHNKSIYTLFGDSWEAVAKALKGTPGVLGYELINEPWAEIKLPLEPEHPVQFPGGNTFSDSKSLGEMYDYLNQRIRAVDNDTIVMYEPLAINSYVSAFRHTTDFPAYGPGGVDYADRQIFAYHSYCPNDPKGVPYPWTVCKSLIDAGWDGVARDLKQVKNGGFLTEFGSVGPDETSIDLITRQTGLADKQLQSWTYWTYKGFDDITTQNAATETFFFKNGTIQENKVHALARTYAQAIAGQPTEMLFDPKTLYFGLNYTTLDGVQGPTEVFVLKDLYPSGIEVTITPKDVATWTLKWEPYGILEITHIENLPAGTKISVSIKKNA